MVRQAHHEDERKLTMRINSLKTRDLIRSLPKPHPELVEG